MKNDILISVVSPVYRAEKIVDELVAQIVENVSQFTQQYEIILVEDGSIDNSWNKIAAHCNKDPRITGIKLSRNFGQHYAITAGIDQAQGEWIVVMDCDLQDDPKEIINLYNEAITKQFDIVLAQRNNRQNSFFKKASSTFFYSIFSYLTGMKQDGTVANFGIYHKKVIDIVKNMREPMRAFPAMINWVGFKKGKLLVKHQSRYEGKSTYNWHRLINLAMDISLAYSDKPIKLTVKTGFIISAGAMGFAVYTFIRYSLGKITVSGYASLIMSIWFLSGLIIFILGIVGLYLGKVFESVKNRPIYIIDKKIN